VKNSYLDRHEVHEAEGARISDPNATLPPGTHLLKVGKRKFARITVK